MHLRTMRRSHVHVCSTCVLVLADTRSTEGYGSWCLMRMAFLNVKQVPLCAEQIVDEQMLRGWTILTDVATAAHWQERRGSLTGVDYPDRRGDGCALAGQEGQFDRWVDYPDRRGDGCALAGEEGQFDSTSRHKRKAYAVHFAVERVTTSRHKRKAYAVHFAVERDVSTFACLTATALVSSRSEWSSGDTQALGLVVSG
ncbi:uncharacterized protein EMH_0067140 [Eimeria mitis]|uniref:Uncharacterized protein n=1 Tax=Eimeria mitis TaxID=44415 RepID=U6K175_9EIME|nr:uncharacterized protein EMH_0067140 [Eimeria mitis]CDJ31480.1 hypothetical protein EMH_0067140 [Eimeria mitis]